MIKDMIDFFEGKKILILGFGREGKSTYNLIRKYLKNQLIFIADEKEIHLEDENAVCISGEGYLENLDQYDIIMKSPRNFFCKN